MTTYNTGKLPLKSQLLKWIGSKKRYAAEIISYFPNTYGRYFEPFIGSGAVLATLSPQNGIGSDNFKPLIEIWKALKERPEQLKKWYDERWWLMNDRESKAQAYEQIKASYNKNPNGADLLFLSRSCYGGVVRFRKSDGFMSTPCGIHKPIPPNAFSNRVDEWHQRVQGTEFKLLDYAEAMEMAKEHDLVYCDPPYFHSQSILYGAQDFQIKKLFEVIARCKSRGVYVVLSIDGLKKSGDHICELPIPEGLFESEIMIHCGKSMLKRFKMEGKELVKEGVSDRLLLTYHVHKEEFDFMSLDTLKNGKTEEGLKYKQFG